MRPFSTLVLLLACIVLICSSSLATAEVIFQDDFDGHTAGTLLSSYTPPVGDSYTGPWAIYADGGVGATDYTGQVSAVDNEQLFISAANTTAVTGQVVQFNYDYFAMPQAVSGSDFVTFDAGPGGYTGRGWDLLLYGNGSIQYYDADVAGGYVTAAPAGTFTTYDWISVEVVADYGTHTFDATVDGFSFSGSWEVTGGDTFQQLYMAANGGNFFYIDNMKIQTVEVPEPTMLGLLVTGLFGLSAYVWRKRK